MNEVLRDRIRSAEALRLKKNYRAARNSFEDIRNDPEWGTLTKRQERWVLAHYGAAVLDSFTYHTDAEGLLDEAELLLREALVVLRDDKNLDPLDKEKDEEIDRKDTSPWAWARLGEVFRLKGNLPPFHLTRNDLRLRASGEYYRKSARCFAFADPQECGGPQRRHPGAVQQPAPKP